MYNITSEPQPGINGRTYGLLAAHVVGGGTVVNGMAFDRGSAGDYDLWQDLGNPGWGWSGLLPYFKKVGLTYLVSNISDGPLAYKDGRVKRTPRRPQLWQRSMEYSMTPQHTGHPALCSLPCHHTCIRPSVSAYTCLFSVFLPNEPELTFPELFFKAWQQLGISTPKDGANGGAIGAFWFPSSVDPRDRTRSYARTAYYEPHKGRSNFHLLTGKTVTKLVLDGNIAKGVKVSPNPTNPDEI